MNFFKEWCDEYVRALHQPMIERTAYEQLILWSPAIAAFVVTAVAIIVWAYLDIRKKPATNPKDKKL